ncbi:glycine cleavage system aminomethyltransferase GcvT [Lentisphaera profundi]|uniref:aminomethyltransferase n=1 Tax=Lentisphaera profundi TaxID=1658616 RepID=A0ABY7VXJ8_9BACT|nr:glycine cleavage system aminomethyltransferase GcvT [Lentisphaera profundi]WDE98003.1 glycine cleavage system aminomethyltransferase GcvT [Lentisphaera profundi]
MEIDQLQKTALLETHIKHGGRIVDFGGWALPVQFTSMIKEHKAVRSAAGLFDCSHMGQFFISGKDAYAYVQYMISNDLDKIAPGRGLYSGLLYENGTFVDDIIVYLEDKENIFIVVNASNIEKDFAWFESHKGNFDVSLENKSDEYSLLALQGPTASETVEKFFPGIYDGLETFGHAAIEFEGQSGYICRSGYTGEAGVEIIIKNEAAPALFDAIVEAGVLPCGLGSRDTLRLEKGFSLYGHEITDKTNALEAGLAWVCALNTKENFIGKAALEKIKAEGKSRKLIGFTVTERPIARDGEEFIDEEGNVIGLITSATHSPMLKQGIGLGYLPVGYDKDTVQIRTARKVITGTLCKRIFV